MSTRMRCGVSRGAAATMVVLAAFLAAPSPAAGDSLVMFKNGKVLRVKNATRDGVWLKCEFEDKNFISVPASSVLKIEESGLGGSGADLRPNQVAAGSGGGYVPGPQGGGDGGPPPEMGSGGDSAAPDDPSIGMEEEAAYQRQKAMEMQSAASRRGMVRGIPGQPGQNPAGAQQGTPTGFPGGMQPLSQSGNPMQNRRLNSRRGMPNDRLPVRPSGQTNQDE